MNYIEKHDSTDFKGRFNEFTRKLNSNAYSDEQIKMLKEYRLEWRTSTADLGADKEVEWDA